jgi:hypothetical protein
MQKLALLIGVSEYESGLPPLPSATRDVDAMRRVLEHPEMGNFDQVKSLLNPDPKTMEEEIEVLFSGRNREDLVVLFFSGHGILDEKDKLYFATRTTRKLTGNDFVKTSTVSARFLHERMGDAPCQQVLILDCCYSGAIADGLTMKSDSRLVDVKTQLGGEGRAVLTSSTGIQPSFVGKEEGELSIYTQYVVEGIETGLGDADFNRQISVVELHNYAKRNVQAATNNAMQPKIYSIGEGFNIVIAEAPEKNPQQIYREEVEWFYQCGKLSFRGTLRSGDRKALHTLRCSLSLSNEDATVIEREVLEAYRERQQKIGLLRQMVEPILNGEEPMTNETRRRLIRLQRILDLRFEDIDPAFANLLNPHFNQLSSLRKLAGYQPRSPQQWRRRGLIGIALSVAAIGLPLRLHPSLSASVDDALYNAGSQLSEVTNQLNGKLFLTPSTALPDEIFQQMLLQVHSKIHLTEAVTRQMQMAKSYDEVKAGATAWRKVIKHWEILVQQVRQQYIITDTSTREIRALEYLATRYYDQVNSQWEFTQRYLTALEPGNTAYQQQQAKIRKTRQDWQSIANKWRAASTQMSSIRTGPYAERAQQKAKDYQYFAQVAEKQVKRICNSSKNCSKR